MQTYRFEVTKLNCGGCAGRAERALAAVEGVSEASVNLANKVATVEGPVALDALHAALKTAGYPAAEARISLAIEGMSCASCAGRVEAALHALDPVISAHVNLTNNTAEVTVVGGMIDGPTLAQVITDAGYPAHPLTADSDPDARHAQEIRHLRQDLIIAGALTLPVFLGVMGGHAYPPLHHWLHGMLGQSGWWMVQFLLTTAVLLGPGLRFYRIGVPLLFKGAPDMNTLVALGTFAAWAYSSVALFLPGLLPDNARDVYFEAAAVIVTLILLGRFLEARAKGRTGAAIRRLIGLRPKTALVLDGDTPVETPIEDIAKGDVLLVKAGEQLPVDAEILTGQSHIDESMITGEPIPVLKEPGDRVIGGTLNGSSPLTIRAQAVGAETMLARIIAMVEQAQGAKLPIQALADQVVRWFVPAVLVLAALTLSVWLIFGPGMTFALVASVSVLIIACPCAMGLATPVSIMVGTGRAAELGVLFRKGDALQRLDGIKVVAFDKTGTLTQGRPDLVEVALAPGFTRDTILQLAAQAEAGSSHPIAAAILRASPDAPVATEIQDMVGFGLIAQINGQEVLVGAKRLLAQKSVSTDAVDDAVAMWTAKGHTPVYIAIDGTCAGALAIADPLKPDAASTIAALHQQGLKVAMLTGDNTVAAQSIAQTLGIDIVHAEILPEDKMTLVRALRDTHGPVAFCGDGINDAPALAEADVGLAIGTGTDVAIEAGDVVLASGQVSGVPVAVGLSTAVMRNIRQNLFWAFGYNIALIPVAAGVLYPLTGMMLSPMLAAGAMALSSVFVLSNALRLRTYGGRP
ncbi:MAG: heavy metal translocating P-type ATPase [Pelagimonas sp.]|jgi:Cu+-exporting ATPase|nr:heavy metal translocating P-type ATPase [Pelagimonas sp.]